MRGLAKSRSAPGILIFVSLAERYARIIADDGISAKVPQSQWQSAIDALIAHMRDGRIADGFVAAIDLCGDELARNFPRTEPAPDESAGSHLCDPRAVVAPEVSDARKRAPWRHSGFRPAASITLAHFRVSLAILDAGLGRRRG